MPIRRSPVTVLLFAGLACAGHPPAAEQPVVPPTGEAEVAVPAEATFRLQPNEVVAVAGGQLLVRFVGVRDDSRCPVGVDCVWEGSAEAVVATVEPGGEWRQLSLHTAGGAREAEVGGFTISLVAVEPSPRAATAIDPATYRLVLRISR